MTPAVIFPDAQALVIDELRTQLVTAGRDIPVASTVPRPRPDEFVHVIRTGGTKRTPVSDAAQITIDTWATLPSATADLAMLVRAIVTSFAGQQIGSTQCYRVDEFSGPADIPDPATGTPRYRQTFAVHLRGTSFTH